MLCALFYVLFAFFVQGTEVLQDGIPQSGNSSVGNETFYRFFVPEGSVDVTISVSRRYGDPDIYVTTGDDLPTPQNYTWRSIHFGEDLLTITPTDDDWCTNCTYTIGVYAASNTSYTIVAVTSEQSLQLQEGVPVREDLTQQQYEYFSFHFPADTEELTFTVTPLGNGDPDIFVSANHSQPNRTSYDWSSQRLYGDSITISHTDPKACRNCTYWVSVYAFTNTTFTIVAHLNGTINLQDGVPQSGSVVRGAFVYYDFQAHGGVPVTFTSTTINGSSSLYVSAGDVLPTLANYTQFAPYYTQLKSLTLNACTGSLCNYKIGVYGVEDATYHLIATTQGGPSSVTLVSGIAHRDTVPAQEWRYYSIKVEQLSQDLSVVVTPISGDPDLYISLSNPRPNATSYDKKAARYGSDTITYENASLGTYYIGVNAFSTSTFNVLALVGKDNCTDSNCTVRLLDGQPQEGTVEQGHYDYYTFEISSNKSLLSLTLTKEYGDPDVYVAVNGAFPNVTYHNWSSTSIQNDSIAIPNPPLGHYIFGVYAYQTAGYSLTVSTQGGNNTLMISLQNGVPIRGSGDLQSYQYYVLPVDSIGTEDFTVTVTPFSGDPDLYVSVTNTHPNKTNSTWSAFAFRGDSVTVPFTDSNFCLCPFYISVFSFSASTYSLVASYTAVQNLQDGLPQSGYVALHAFKYYRLRVVQPHDDLTISVTPRDGNPDLYVSVGIEPRVTNATWKVVDQNSTISTLIIRASDPNFCRESNCVYYIGVYGNTASNYSVTAVTSLQRQELQDGVPVRSWVDLNQWQYFSFTVPSVGHNVTILVTPLSGDPDLYVAHNTTTPNATNSEYVSRAAGADAVAIDGSPATTWNIGVFAYQNSTFTITAYILCNDCPPVMLVNGVPQNGILNKNDYQYYRFFLPSSNRSTELTVSLTRIVGDPDLFMATGYAPNKTHFNWSSSAFGQDMVTIDNPEPAIYEIAVFAYSTTQYTLLVSTEAAAPSLQDGVAVRENLVKDQYEYFQVHVDHTEIDLTVTVTSFNGDPDLFISTNNTKPNATDHDFAAQSPREDSITIPSSRLRIGNYWISVRAWTNCTFTIVSSFSNEMHLQDGTPQAGSVAFEASKFYRFVLGAENHTDITFTLTPYNGNAYLFVSNTEPPLRTNSSTYQWSSTDSTSQVITIFPSDAHWCRSFPCVFYVSAYGVQACNYSITAASSVTTISLQEGVPQRAWVSTGEYEYFIFTLNSPSADLHITVTPLSGDPDLYVSTTHERPNQTNNEWHSANYGPDAVDIDYTDPKYKMGTYYIGVYAWRNSTFTIVATVTDINETGCTDPNQCPYNLLQTGIPQVGFLNASGEREYYEFHVGSQQNVTFTVTPRYGDPDIFIRVDGLRPNSSFYQWFGRNYGRDSVTIISNCTNCRYLIDVEAFSHTMFSIVATTDDVNTITLLENGVPLIAHNDQGSYKYFYVIVSDSGRNESLTISATALSGDPDLYVSRTIQHPNRTNFDNASVSFGSDMYILQNPAPGTYYVSTYAFQNASYILLATNGPISLVNNEPHSDELDKEQSRMYQILVQDANMSDLLITLNVESGNPLLYVNNFQNRSYPNATSYMWTTANATLTAQRYVMSIPSNSSGACYNCSYFIQVVANVTLTKYSITVSYGSRSLRTLSSGLPFTATVAKGNYTYFRGIVDRRDVDLTIGVTTFAGDTDVYVSVTDPSPKRDQPDTFQWSSRQNNSRGDLISISHMDEDFETGMYYIGVYGVQDSQFTVIMSTDATLLTPGTSQIGVLGANLSAYYYLSLSGATDVTLSLTSFNSTGTQNTTYQVCFSTNSSVTQPNQTHNDFCKKFQEGQSQTLTPDQCPGNCRGYYLGVFGPEAYHRFTILASTDDKADVLFSASPFSASVSAGRTKYFTIFVPSASNVTVKLETCSGDVDLYASQETYGPGPHNARWLSEQHNQIDKVEVQDPTLRNFEMYIGVLGYSKNESSEYVLTTWLEPLSPSPQPGGGGMIMSLPSSETISVRFEPATSDVYPASNLKYRVYWIPEALSQSFVMYSSCGLTKGLGVGLQFSELLEGTTTLAYPITGLEMNTAYKVTVVVEDQSGQRGFYTAVYQTTTGETSGISIKLLLGIGLPITAVVLTLVIYLIVRNRNLTKELEIEMHDVPKAAVRKAVAGPQAKEEKQTKQYSRLLQHDDDDDENYAPPDPSAGLSVN